LTVFALAIDSAMSLIEAVSVAIRDKFEKVPVEIITLVVSIILGIGSMLYVFGNGLYVLDIVDHFVTSWSMLFIGVAEALIFLIIGKKLIDFIKQRNSCKLKFIFNSYYFWISFVLNVVVLAILLYLNIKAGIGYGDYKESYLWLYGVYVVIGIYGLAILINIIDILFSKKK
jgi:NSS family neurotransmitter:Na+ symporter